MGAQVGEGIRATGTIAQCSQSRQNQPDQQGNERDRDDRFDERKATSERRGTRSSMPPYCRSVMSLNGRKSDSDSKHEQEQGIPSEQGRSRVSALFKGQVLAETTAIRRRRQYPMEGKCK